MGTLDEALAAGRAARPRRAHPPGPVPRPGHAAAARRQHLLLATPSTGATSTRIFASADIVVEGEYTFPGVYQYAMETHTVIAAVGGGRDHALGHLPAPVPGARGDRGAVRRAAGQGAHHRAVPRRRLRQQVVHQDGAHHGGPRAQGRPAREDRQPRRRVDGHDPPPRRQGLDAHRGGRDRPPAGARGAHLVRHRRLRRQRPARDRHRRRLRARPLSLGRRSRCDAALRPHQHRAVGLVPRVRRVAHPVGGRAPGGRGRPPRRHRRARDPAPATCSTPASRCDRAASRSTRTSSATSSKVADALGWDRDKPADTGRGVSVGLLAAGAHPVSQRHRATGGGRRGDRARGLHGDGPGPADGVRADRGGGAGHARGARPLHGHGHPVHALRPLHRRQPLHDARGPRRPARRRRRCARTCWTSPPASGPDAARGRSSCATAPPGAATSDGRSRSSSPSASGCPAASSSARAASTRRAPARTPRGPSSGRSASAPRRSSVDRETGRRDGHPDGDHRGRRHGHQPAARGAAGRGRHDAGHRQRAVRGDGLQRGPAR